MDTEKNMDGQKISFVAEDGTQTWFYVLGQTKFYGIHYLLVTEDEDQDEAQVYILKDLSGEDSVEALYEIVEDEEELHAVAGLFEELLEDVDIVSENDPFRA